VGGRTEIKRIVAAEDMGKSMVGQTVSLCGWVKTAREAASRMALMALIPSGKHTKSY
jgi:tartrate dehydratase beta subunit/fumarate hydratase class I family protein